MSITHKISKSYKILKDKKVKNFSAHVGGKQNCGINGCITEIELGI